MIQYRVMTIHDYDGVYALWTGTAGMGLNAVDDCRAGIEAYLKRNPSTSFVAQENGRTVGAILAGHDGRRGFLYHAAVLPQYRRQGIGRRLVELAMAALDREGIQKAALVAYAQNQAGNRFWAAMGFTTREDLTYRNKAIHETARLSPGQPPHS